MNTIPSLHPTVSQSAPFGKTRFRGIYRIEGSPEILDQTLDLLRKRAEAKRMDLAVKWVSGSETATLFTKEDARIGRPFETIAEDIQTYQQQMEEFRQKQNLEEQQLLEHVKRRIALRILNPVVRSDISHKDWEKLLETVFAAPEKNSVIKTGSLLGFKRLRVEDSVFLQAVRNAVRAFARGKQMIQKKITERIMQFAQENHPGESLGRVYLEACRRLSGHSPLKASQVKQWLEEGTFDINRGTRKLWWPVIRQIARYRKQGPKADLENRLS